MFGCSVAQITDGISFGQGIVDATNEGSSPSTIETTIKAVGGYLPTPFREGLLLLGGIWGIIRGRRHKKALKVTVDAVNKAAPKIGKEAWATLKAELETQHSAKGVHDHMEKIVDKAK